MRKIKAGSPESTSILTGNSYNSDASLHTDTVIVIVYRNTICVRDTNSSDIHRANNTGSAGYRTGNNDRIIVYY